MKKESVSGIAIVAAILGLVSSSVSADLVFSAPPRESRAAGERFYGGLAEYLSKAAGEKVEYRYPDNWGVYQAYMTRGNYDLVLDGPHFVSWRLERLQHEPVAALSGKLKYVVLVRADDTHVKKITDLAGKRVCAHAPPNLATLTLFDRFPNPSRQPRLVEIKGFDNAYAGLITNKCEATVLPLEHYHKLEGVPARARIVYESADYPNLALTAGPRVTPAVRERLTQALLSPEGKSALRAIAEGSGSSEFLATTRASYQGFAGLLRNTWGFEPPAPAR